MSQQDFIVVIPARYGSTRFPGKALTDIHGKPMVAHVVERAKEANATQIVVATDDERIQNAVSSLCDVVMTREDHQSGTERIAEVIEKLALSGQQIIVNVQGDEPFVPAQNIAQVAALLSSANTSMATLYTPVESIEQALDPNVVKLVNDHQGLANYFSRSPIPYQRDAMTGLQADASCFDLSLLKRHIGIYAYRADFVLRYVQYPATVYEKSESLEQLRALWFGERIAVAQAVKPPPVGIDTPEDLDRL